MTRLHPTIPSWVATASRGVGRRFLLLQGPIGTFFDQLAEQLRKMGHEADRITFNGGDKFFCSHKPPLEFSGDETQWPAFLERTLASHQITDIVLFGDCRPLHRVAIAIAEPLGIPVHVFEEGYLRPNWLTLEVGGVNRHSSLSRNPEWYLEHGHRLPEWHPGTPVVNSFRRRATEDVLYRVSSLIRTRRFPGYKTHKPWNPLAEYRSGAKRFFLIPLAKAHNRKVTRKLIEERSRYYILPLQLEADAQIRFHSRHGSMVPSIKQVIASFAQHAPTDAKLVVTEHPLDPGVINLRRLTLDTARAHGLKDRIIYLHCGSSEPLLRASQGLVTVNSTIGMLALEFGLPVKTVGHAIYDIPRLTFQGDLDHFWCAQDRPDPAVFENFRKVVAATSQINGGLYSKAAIQLAVTAAANRLSEIYYRPVQGAAVDSADISTNAKLRAN